MVDLVRILEDPPSRVDVKVHRVSKQRDLRPIAMYCSIQSFRPPALGWSLDGRGHKWKGDKEEPVRAR